MIWSPQFEKASENIQKLDFDGCKNNGFNCCDVPLFIRLKCTAWERNTNKKALINSVYPSDCLVIVTICVAFNTYSTMTMWHTQNIHSPDCMQCRVYTSSHLSQGFHSATCIWVSLNHKYGSRDLKTNTLIKSVPKCCSQIVGGSPWLAVTKCLPFRENVPQNTLASYDMIDSLQFGK